MSQLRIAAGVLSVMGIALAFAPFAHADRAGTFEFSAGGSYSHSNYTDTDYEWTRRYGASVGYYLTSLTEIEVSYQNVVNRTKITNYEDTTFHDEIFGLTISQSFGGKSSWLQPYVKAGIGQLNREASGSYALGVSPPSIVDSVTGILGAGLKIYLTRAIGLRAEATSYLSGGHIGTWKDNISTTFGFSFFLFPGTQRTSEARR
jgi:hypothetical protein